MGRAAWPGRRVGGRVSFLRRLARGKGTARMMLVHWAPEDLIRRLSDVLGVYGAAMDYPFDLVEARRGFGAGTGRPAVGGAAGGGDGEDRAPVHPGGAGGDVAGLAAVPAAGVRGRVAAVRVPGRRPAVRRAGEDPSAVTRARPEHIAGDTR